jgi:hypothetical protein
MTNEDMEDVLLTEAEMEEMLAVEDELYYEITEACEVALLHLKPSSEGVEITSQIIALLEALNIVLAVIRDKKVQHIACEGVRKKVLAMLDHVTKPVDEEGQPSALTGATRSKTDD